jgi:peptidyl-prolyl cis-trans isomerase B (cyclophilin B)
MKRILLLATVLMSVSIVTQAQVKKVPAKPKKAVVKTKAVVKPVKEASEPKIKITTDSGVIILKLYNKTPKHRDNFLKLAGEHFFDSLLFHRVIQGFMIQGGDPNSKYAKYDDMLGSGDVGYTIPAEFDTTIIHKRGALAAARTDNPEKASSGCQFYIVQGRQWSDAELSMLESRQNRKYTTVQRMIYKTAGGTAQLDMNYTVFGEVISGFEVIDKIAGVPRNGFDRPLGDVRMKVEIIK